MTRAKRKKRTPIQRLEAEASVLMGKWVNGSAICAAKEQSEHRCSGVYQNAHIVRRSKGKFIRFSPLNGTCLCSGLHLKYDQSPTLMFLYLQDRVDPERIRRLHAMDAWAHDHCKTHFTHEDLLTEYVLWYKAREDHWIDWHVSGEWKSYTDPIERMMEEE